MKKTCKIFCKKTIKRWHNEWTTEIPEYNLEHSVIRGGSAQEVVMIVLLIFVMVFIHIAIHQIGMLVLGLLFMLSRKRK